MIITRHFTLPRRCCWGGLSKIAGVIDDLAIAVDKRRWRMSVPNRFGRSWRASGARGAAYAAYLKGQVG